MTATDKAEKQAKKIRHDKEVAKAFKELTAHHEKHWQPGLK